MSVLGVISLPPPLQKGIFQSRANSHGTVEPTEKQTPAMENKEDSENHGLLRAPQRQGIKEEVLPTWPT